MRKPFFTLTDGRCAEIFTLRSANGLIARITNYGGTIVDLIVPDRHGNPVDVSLGFDDPRDYERNFTYFGAMIGRVGNRIANASFTLDGKEYHVVDNERGNSLHGGLGFSHRLWDVAEAAEDQLVLTLTSPDGDAGFPGNLKVKVTYRVTADNALDILMEAVTDAPTVVSLTNHCYFNIAGHDAGTLDDQTIRIFAPCFQEVDAALIPTGNQPATQSVFAGLEEGVGFRTVFDSGVEPDHNFLIAERPDGICRKAAEVTSAKTGITLTVSGDGCGVQWYACGGLSAAAVGKGGKGYCRHGGFCLEMQDYVDAPNRPEYPSIRLEPGEVYSRCIRYAFDNSEK